MPDPFTRAVDDLFAQLFCTFQSVGFSRKEGRLWVGAWRHMDKPADLTRAALDFRAAGVPVGQAIPWFWERIDARTAVQYLPHRWRAAEARRLATALCENVPSLTRRAALLTGVDWAASAATPDECLAAVKLGHLHPPRSVSAPTVVNLGFLLEPTPTVPLDAQGYPLAGGDSLLGSLLFFDELGRPLDSWPVSDLLGCLVALLKGDSPTLDPIEVRTSPHAWTLSLNVQGEPPRHLLWDPTCLRTSITTALAELDAWTLSNLYASTSEGECVGLMP